MSEDMKVCKAKRDEHWASGQYDEVLEQSNQLLNMQRVTYGENSTEYAATLAMAAHAHERLGNATHAWDLVARALKIQASKVGLNHTSVANTFIVMAKIDLKTGLYARAVQRLIDARRIVERVKGQKDPLYWEVHADLGAAYSEMGLQDVALKICKECLVEELTRSGENSVATAKLRRSIGRIYYAQGKHDDASAELNKAVKVLKAKLGGTHPDYMECLNALVSTHYHLGQFEKVIPLYEDTLQAVGVSYGKEHAAYLTAEQNLQMVHQYVSAAKS